MDSKSILSSYLLKRSYMEFIIPFSQFKRLFPSGVEESFVESIYNELQAQRQEAVIEPVKDNISNSFDIPIEVVLSQVDGSGSHIKKNSLIELSGSLQGIIDSATSDSHDYDVQINRLLKDINEVVDELNDLRYAKSIEKIDSLTNESIESCVKLDNYLRLDK